VQVFKDGPIFEDASALNPFSQSLRVYPPKLRADSEDGLGLRGKIERILGLVIIKPVHAEAVVEEDGRSARPIGDKPVKPSVQTGRKAGIFLVEVNEIPRPVRLDPVASLF
jgi:hypothetical protein